MGALRLLTLSAIMVSAGAAKRKLTPSEDCIVTSTYPDGTKTQRDCYVLSENSPELRPGTKGRFESCTQ